MNRSESDKGGHSPRSVLEAIKMGIWDFEVREQQPADYSATNALPGTDEKVRVLAQRAAQGLPLWHPQDRRAYDESASD